MDKAQTNARIKEIDTELAGITAAWEDMIEARDKAQAIVTAALTRKRDLQEESVKLLRNLVNRRGEAK